MRLPSATGARGWILFVLLALAPMWLIGTLDRGAWTPDEPREADIAWRMSVQSHWVLPQLASQPFLEKPPLSYWMSAASMRLFGPSARAARAPNLLYAAITAVAIGALGFAMDGAVAAIVAALVAGTALTAFRVTMWLAPDACLLAGCAIALLGAYLGYTAAPGRRKLYGYLLMHAGAAAGFMAKSAPGWLVPALALLTLIAWERRWSELLRPELHAGFLLQAVIIGPWILAVAHTAHGAESLRILFWYNLAGRFTDIAAPAAYHYSTGHRNFPGKYLLELPVYLMPWTALAAAAAWRVRGPGTCWRFAVAASLPFLLLLTLAATARDVYAAPALLGVSLLIALEISAAQRLSNRDRRDPMRWTRRLVAVIACALAAALAVIGIAKLMSDRTDLAAASTIGEYLCAIALMLALAGYALRRAARFQLRGEVLCGFQWTFAAYAVTFCVTSVTVFPTIDRWHDLPVLAGQIHSDSKRASLALLNPDETTIAMLDFRSHTPFTVLTANASSPRSLVSGWFAAEGSSARVLVLLPGHAPGELTPLLERLHLDRSAAGDGVAGELASEGVASIVRRYRLPHGRRYALLAPPPTPPDLSGVVRCAGGDTMAPLVKRWARQFHELHPGAVIEIDPRARLAADGFRELLAGRVDLVDFVREPFPREIDSFEREFGYAPSLINVANGSYETRGGTHAIAIYVNSSNPVRHLALGQLEAIFSAATPRRPGMPVRTWGGVGLKGSWARRPIHAYGMSPLRSSGNPPGIVNFIEIRVLRGNSFRSDLRMERDRPGKSALQAIVRAVASDPDGIGYSGFGYALPGVKTVALATDAGGPYVQGGPEQVADRSYPLSRQIYFGLNRRPGHPLPPLVKAFIELALSPQGQQMVSDTPDHFLALTPAQVADARLQLLGRAPPADRASPTRDASSAISIIGYNDMREMLEALDELFEHAHPGVHFALTLKGTRTAPAALATGHSLLAPMGAEFQPDQLAAYRRVVGSDPIAFRVAHDSLEPQARSGPLVVFVPAANPLPDLTLAQLERIFASDARGLRWAQLGLTGNLANRPIHMYGLAAATPLGRFMRQHVLAGRPFGKRFIGLSESAEVVREVGDDPLGIGFAAINHATPAVRMVPLSRREGERPSRATRADILAGRYPLDRYLLMYVRIPPGGRLDPIARDYLRLVLSPEGQRAVASGHLGYLPLSAAEAAAERAKLEALP